MSINNIFISYWQYLVKRHQIPESKLIIKIDIYCQLMMDNVFFEVNGLNT